MSDPTSRPPPVYDSRNVDFPHFEVLSRSLSDFEPAEVESEIRELLIEAGGIVKKPLAWQLTDVLGDWYTGRPHIWWFQRPALPPNSSYPDAPTSAEPLELIVRGILGRVTACHHWIAEVVSIIGRHEKGTPEETLHADQLGGVLIELIEHFWTLGPHGPEEAWHADIQEFVRLVLEAKGLAMTGELGRSIGTMSNRIFESWVHPSPGQLNEFANDASWAIIASKLDERYDSDNAKETPSE